MFRKTKKGQANKTPYLLLLPAFIVVFAIAAYTFWYLFRMSLVDWTFGAPWESAEKVGFENFIWLLINSTSPLWDSLKITVIYTLGSLLAELFIGFSLALLLNEKIFGSSIYTSLLIIPIVIMPSMVGMIWRLYFSFDGLVNYFLESLIGIKVNWFSRQWALLAAMIVDIWEWTPFFILIFLAGLRSLPVEPFESARVDGASNWQILIYLTLPIMTPLILVGSILRFMDLLRIFDVIFVMFGGGPGNATTTLPILVWRETMMAQNTGRGSAVSIMLIILIVSFTTILYKLYQKSRQEGKE
ncbi:Melibiose/raffinose/stachyose import permease protein MelD [subsurface metagenome]